MIYAMYWLVSLSGAVFTSRSRQFGKLLAVALALAGTILIVMRGAVGTDTVPVYESFATRLAANGLGSTVSTIEPGFQLLLAVLLRVTPSPTLAIRLVGVVYGLALLFYVLRSTRTELLFILAIYLPAFLFPYGMNVLRIGLASVFILLSTQYFSRRTRKLAILTALLAVSLHYSSSFIIALLIVSTTQRLVSRRSIALAGLIIVGAAALVVWDPPYISTKLGLYTDYFSPTPLSGIRSLSLVLSTLVALLVSNLPRNLKVRLLLILGTTAGAAMLLSTYSYAGLRVLDLIAFSAPLALVLNHSRHRVRLNNPSLFLLIMAGVLFAAATFRGFILESATVGVLSPFLPYHTLAP